MFTLLTCIGFRIVNGPMPRGGSFNLGLLAPAGDVVLAYVVLDHFWGLGWF